MSNDWVVIANSRRARCFERQTNDRSLAELSDFVNFEAKMQGAADTGVLEAAATKGHGRTAHAGTQFEPHTQLKTKEQDNFAHRLADYINDAVESNRCSGIVLIASQPMLGKIKPRMSAASSMALRRCVPRDLTRYQGPELKRRVDHAMELPD